MVRLERIANFGIGALIGLGIGLSISPHYQNRLVMAEIQSIDDDERPDLRIYDSRGNAYLLLGDGQDRFTARTRDYRYISPGEDVLPGGL